MVRTPPERVEPLPGLAYPVAVVHFVAEIVEGPRIPNPVATLRARGGAREGVVRSMEFESLVDGFGISLSTNNHLLPEPFHGQQVVQLDFSTEIPWVIPEQEPES